MLQVALGLLVGDFHHDEDSIELGILSLEGLKS
jgi:hypothetical protein